MRAALPDMMVGMNVGVPAAVAARFPDGGATAQIVGRGEGGATYTVSRQGVRMEVAREELVPQSCTHCGADLYSLKCLLLREEEGKRRLEEEVQRYKAMAGVYESDANAMREELRRVEKQLDAAVAAAAKRSSRLETRFQQLVAARVADAEAAADETVAAATDATAADAQHRAQKAEHQLQKAKKTLRAVADACYAALQAARTAFDTSCKAFSIMEDEAAADPAAAAFLTPLSSLAAETLVQIESSHDWAAQACELAGRPRPAGLPPAPPPRPPPFLPEDDVPFRSGTASPPPVHADPTDPDPSEFSV